MPVRHSVQLAHQRKQLIVQPENAAQPALGASGPVRVRADVPKMPEAEQAAQQHESDYGSKDDAEPDRN